MSLKNFAVKNLLIKNGDCKSEFNYKINCSIAITSSQHHFINIIAFKRKCSGLCTSSKTSSLCPPAAVLLRASRGRAVLRRGRGHAGDHARAAARRRGHGAGAPRGPRRPARGLRRPRAARLARRERRQRRYEVARPRRTPPARRGSAAGALTRFAFAGGDQRAPDGSPPSDAAASVRTAMSLHNDRKGLSRLSLVSSEQNEL